LPKFDNPDFLNREQHFSDAGIYRISATQALVQTVDFFTPIVDDPYTFGQIAAANSLSDVYAMGGKPLTALNIICFPVSCQPLEVMEAILRGGYDKVIEAGAVVVGGHSIEDPEPKYGLSVTGLVEIDQLITSHGAKPGDILVLTKPLGTGIIATALKGGMIAEKDAVEAVRGMSQLNAAASETMSEVGVTACTDVTGFSLLGHLREMLITSAVSAEIDYQKVPLYPAVTEMMAMGMIPAGAYRNLEYIRPHVDWQGSPEAKEDALIIMADPQTSGGLLVALSPEKVDPYLALLNEKGTAGHPIGQISADQAGRIVIR
jgi:selenide, water dikinase